MTKFGGIPYSEQLALARRYDKVVDFASPISAWTSEMLAQKVKENKLKDIQNDI